MATISIQEVISDPDGLIGRLKSGESLILTQDGMAVGEIHPAKAPETEPRPHGLAKGQFKVPPEFFEPLPEDILRGFEGS